MKISNVSTMVMGTPWRNLLFVKVETDDGLVGWAEARPVGGVGPVIGYLNESVPDFVLGRDPFNTELMAYRMLRETYGRAGEIAMTGIALLEIACWDIVGKALDQPVYRLLGGAMREQDQSLRQRLVSRGADAGSLARGGERGGRQGLPRPEIRPLRQRLL